MTDKDSVSLTNIGGGAAVEKFDEELSRVLANLMDPNTTADAREIIMKVKLKPDEDRKSCDVSFQTMVKLAPDKAYETSFYVGHKDGIPVAVEDNPEQMQLGFDEEEKKPIQLVDRKAETGGK